MNKSDKLRGTLYAPSKKYFSPYRTNDLRKPAFDTKPTTYATLERNL